MVAGISGRGGPIRRRGGIPYIAAVPCRCCDKPGWLACAFCPARYCGRACQRLDWQRHEALCFRAAPPPDEAAAGKVLRPWIDAAAGETEEDSCVLCLSPAEAPMPLVCRHLFCRACIADLKRLNRRTISGSDLSLYVNDDCPLCRVPLADGAGQLVDRAWDMSNLRTKCQEQGDLDEAAHLLKMMVRYGREASELDPSQATCWFLLGWALNQSGEYVSSAQAYRETLHISPNHLTAHYNLAHVLTTKLKDFKGAEREYREVCMPTLVVQFSLTQFDVYRIDAI